MEHRFEVFEDRCPSRAATRTLASLASPSQSVTCTNPISTSLEEQRIAAQTAGQRAVAAGGEASTLPQVVQPRAHSEARQYGAHRQSVTQYSPSGGKGSKAASYGAVRNCHLHASSKSPYGMIVGKNWWTRGRHHQQQQQQHFARPISAQAACGKPHQKHHQQSYGSMNRELEGNVHQQIHDAAQPALPVMQPPPAASAVTFAPYGASASPELQLRDDRQIPGQQRFTQMQSASVPAAQRRMAVESRPMSNSAQPRKNSDVHAHQPSPVRQQHASAMQRSAGTRHSSLSQLHHEVDAFARRAAPTAVSHACDEEPQRCDITCDKHRQAVCPSHTIVALI